MGNKEIVDPLIEEGRLVILDQPVKVARKASSEHQVYKDLQEILEQVVPKGPEAIQVIVDYQESWAKEVI